MPRWPTDSCFNKHVSTFYITRGRVGKPRKNTLIEDRSGYSSDENIAPKIYILTVLWWIQTLKQVIWVCDKHRGQHTQVVKEPGSMSNSTVYCTLLNFPMPQFPHL